jgi:hypothetical protein
MNKIFLIFILLFPLPLFAEWVETNKSVDGDTYYIDLDRIRKHDGYVYYWVLEDLLKPTQYGDLSGKVYMQGDCKLFRYKILSSTYYTQPMARGTYSATGNNPEKEWTYIAPNSVAEVPIKIACSR